MNAIRVFVSFFAFLSFAFYFKMILNRSGKNNKKNFESYIQEERESMFFRRREIDEDLFLKPNMNTFPIVEYDDVQNLSDKLRKVYDRQCNVIKKSNSKMLYLKNLSNLEIKKRFGIANLESIASYEQNYQNFNFAVFDWADSLNKAESYDDAILALEASLDFGSSYSKSFKLLADLYFIKKDMKKLEILLSKVSLLEDAIQKRVTAYINDYLNQRL